MTIAAIAPARSTTAPNTVAAVNPLFGANPTTASALSSAQEQSDRFLKLLVTQMKNQDPLNPMDNAQITTQMAQISTVSGIDKLSATMATVNASLLQMQSLEGAVLIGKDVLLQGDKLSLASDGSTSAGFDLDASAKSVVATIKDAAGNVVDSLDLGALPAGRHAFEWVAADPLASGLRFEVTATNGADTVGLTRLVADRVEAVYFEHGMLSLQTAHNGKVKYSEIKGVS